MSTFPAVNAISTAANQGVGKQALEDFLAATKQIPGAGVAETTLTLSANVSGTITPTQGVHQVDTASSAATGDLANILQTNLDDGSLLMIRSVNAGRVVVVKHSAGGAGQISLINAVDLSLDTPSQYLLLKRTGALWQEVGYFTLSTGTGKFVRATSPTIISPTISGGLTQAVGANVASASTINLTNVAGNACHVTGTTTITAVTLAAGKFCEVIFDGALTLTHHATNNNLPGAANITTAAGDRALYWSDGTTVYCLHYQKADGTSVVGSANSYVVLQVTRDLTLSAGAVQTGHGMGKTPKLVRIEACREVGSDMSWGSSDGTNHMCIRHTNGGVANMKTTRAVWLTSSDDSNYQSATASFDNTYLTFTWDKTGSPSGTGTLVCTLFF